MVFSGDTLFAGGVGRVDLFGEDRMNELAGQLYDSIFEKLLPLGDGIILCPAHGAGSVCGSTISERSWTTIGLEKRINPALQVESREEFIDKNAKMLERPPYFRKMEKLNLAGPPVLGRLPMLQPLQPDAFEQAAKKAQVVDTRGEIAYGSAHLPGSLSIWEAGLPAYAGWYLDYDRPILIVTEAEDTRPIVRMLIRIGFDRLAGALKEGVLTWAKSGKPLETIGTLSARELCERMKGDTDAFILDVRGAEEIKDDGLEHGLRIHATVLSRHLDRIPQDRPIIVVCPSGLRSMFAASYLRKEGWGDLNVLIGGLEGWESFNCDAVL
jgi:hydroxyacylglutathione hydrolase